MTTPLNRTQSFFYQGELVSDFKGKKVIRSPFSGCPCDLIGRKIIYALALIFSLGLAQRSDKIQKLKQEISEKNKITFIPKDAALVWGNYSGNNPVIPNPVQANNSAPKEIQEPQATIETNQILSPKLSVTKESAGMLNKAIITSELEPSSLQPIVTPTQSNATSIVSNTPVQGEINANPLSHSIQIPISAPQNNAIPIVPVQNVGVTTNRLAPVIQAFSQVKSNKDNLIPLDFLKDKSKFPRDAFKKEIAEGKMPLRPVMIAISDFVPNNIVEHLMRQKQDSKLGQKMKLGDAITNMEGALHTFVTPITPIIMSGDYVYKCGHRINHLIGMGRNVILSAAIHPDFEKGGNDEVVMKIVGITNNSVKGAELSTDFEPLWKKVKGDKEAFGKELPAYEKMLQQHMVYHLTDAHCLPALSEIKPESIKTSEEVLQSLDSLIKNGQPVDAMHFKNQFVTLNGYTVSLEALFNLYKYQINNEFSVLEKTLPQGYIYTINPPAIFAHTIGHSNVKILNRLQLLALKIYQPHLKNLKGLGIANFADPDIVDLYKTAFSNQKVCAKDALFSDNGFYSVQEEYALVIHNNSDAFGQNIETEGMSSLDGVVGCCSNASSQLDRKNPNLVDYIVNVI